MFCHIMSRGRTDLLVLLHAGCAAPQSWLKALETDLIWVAASSPKLVEFQQLTFATLIGYFLGNTEKALKTIKEDMVHHCKYPMVAAVDAPIVATTVFSEGVLTYPVCLDVLDSKQSLFVHSAREHQILRMARNRVISSLCTVCLRRFVSRSKCLCHLNEKSVACLVSAMLLQLEYSEEEVAEAGRQGQDQHRQTIA